METAVDRAVTSSRKVLKARPTKAAKTGGKLRLKTLEWIDNRTLASRRARQLINAMEIDLGGSEHLTEGARQLVQRAAVLGTYIESTEAQWLAGETVELNDYLMMVNAQRRVLATIGIDRRSRDVTPRTLDDIAKEIDAEEDAAEDGDPDP
jgi:hypothetical protein